MSAVTKKKVEIPPPPKRGRPPRMSDDTESASFRLPIGMKDQIRLAMAKMRVSGQDAPRDMTAFVVAAIEEKIARISARK